MPSQGMVAADGRLVLLNGKSGDQLTDWQEMREDRLPANGVLPGKPGRPPQHERSQEPSQELSLERAAEAARVVAGWVLDARWAA
jgi:hypothetical protein